MPGSTRLWNRLGFRVTAIVLAVTILTLGAFAALVLRTQRLHLEGQVNESAALLSDTIRNSTYLDMLADRRESAYAVMETIGQQEGIDHVRIFNKEGRITFSTEQEELGRYVDKRAESCFACHAADQPIVRLNLPSRTRTYQHDGHRELGMVTPIYNEPACSNAACHVHPAGQRVLGVIDIGISLAKVDAAVARMQSSTTWLSAIAMLLVGGLVTLLVRRSVVKPVLRLARGTQRIGGGDLTPMPPTTRTDEIGHLERSFNSMAESLARMRAERLELLASLEQQVEDRTAELKAANAQLVRSEKLSSLGRLAASIAHEINNPLAGILTYAKFLIRTLDEVPVSEATRESAIKQLRLVQRETERCTAIVRNLLEFARERPIKVGPVDLRAVIDEALTLLSNEARLRTITIEKDFSSFRLVHGDAGQLRQAVMNILINASDAMPGGGVLRITTVPDDAKHLLDLQVQDTGCGISPENLQKVLDPFFTTKEKGTGLGLSVVYGIVERHGGSVQIESAVGQGTTVHLRLPLVDQRPREGSGQEAPAVGRTVQGVS